MQPENYTEAPNVVTLVTTPPSDQRFWEEAGRTFGWVRYIWVGPAPKVTVDLNNVFAGRQFSSQAIYEGIIGAVSGLRIPGVVVGPQIIHEAGPFSPHRAYLRIRRELSEFLVCAAPVGTSFFVTVRKIDRFRHVKWWHYLVLLWFLFNVAGSLVVSYGPTAGLVLSALLISLAWSLMRYASHMSMSWLGEKLPEVPLVGALYLRWFRPDTYFRQDLQSAFHALVDGAIREVIQGLDPTQPLRPATEFHGGPIQKDLNKLG